MASADRLIALDARVVLHDASIADADLPRSAIRPYPVQYRGEARLSNGAPVVIRPIRPEDEAAVRRFHQTLSEQSVHQRYLQPLGLEQRTAHERLIRVCFSDYDREIALIAQTGEGAERRIIGIGRLTKQRGMGAGDEADFALLVSDDVQRQGLGSELLRRLIEIARAEGVKVLRAETLPDNDGICKLCRDAGFSVERSGDRRRVDLELRL